MPHAVVTFGSIAERGSVPRTLRGWCPRFRAVQFGANLGSYPDGESRVLIVRREAATTQLIFRRLAIGPITGNSSRNFSSMRRVFSSTIVVCTLSPS